MSTWWVGTRKGLFRIDGDAIGAPAFVGVRVPMVLAVGDTVYAGLEHGHFGPKLHRSDDRGATWTELPAPKLPDGTDASVSTIWSLEAGPDGALWCGTIPGGLFRSVDRGASWTLIRSLWDRPERARWFGGGFDQPGIHSVCAHPTDPGDLVVGVSIGGVWRTRDGGGSFTLEGDGLAARYMPPERKGDRTAQDPHRIVAAPSNPDVLWCQHHSGAFRSTDRGDSWTELEVPPSSFGFAVAVHPQDPDTAWFVPADSDASRIAVGARVVVARTSDGGRSFDVVTDGLPQHHAYDLVYRHALDVDATGDALAFGSTTGGLWASGDGGRRWQTVSTHLPPIYVVRAG
ncbi:MAG: exo-alpha-sialidase [Myxococcota bacterium]